MSFSLMNSGSFEHDFRKFCTLRKNKKETGTLADIKYMSTMDSTDSVTCDECKHNFKRFYDLRKHVEKFHAHKLEQLAPLNVKSYEFQCTVCQKNFSARRNLKWHLKLHTAIENSSFPGNQGNLSDINVVPVIENVRKKCPLCDFVAKYKTDFIKHFQEAHDVDINVEKLHFHSAENFSVWFSDIQKETRTQFIMEKSSVSKHETYVSYICHRSGSFKSRSLGFRRLKSQGSKKINGYCPAGIQVVIDNERGNHEIIFVRTHVGHQNDLSHIPRFTQQKKLRDRKKGFNPVIIPQESNDQQLTILENLKVGKSTVIFHHLQSKESSTSQIQSTLSDRKGELIEKMTNEINNIESEKELFSVEKILASLGPTIRAVRQEDAISLGQHVKANGTPARTKKI